MSEHYEMRAIAHIYNDFPEKFGVPRQSGLAPAAKSTIVFEEDMRFPESLRGIEEYSHMWLIWVFSGNAEQSWSPTVRPPRLGGNKRAGVFATRSPFRPNPVGLSSVRLDSVRREPGAGTVLCVSGADLVSGTPILDIKPYVKYSDAHPDALCGFSDEFSGYALEVVCPPAQLSGMSDAQSAALLEVLKSDPRPAYQSDPARVYRMSYAGSTVSFTVDGSLLTVTQISPSE